MKILKSNIHSVRRQQAFTMIEIALALAVIGFALVAVIGILPTGLTAQRENREETIVNQDGPYFIELIRNGSEGMDHLLQYVEEVGIVTLINSDPSNPQFSTNFTYYENLPQAGSNIIGLISIPQGKDFQGDPVQRVIVRTRALTGSSVEAGSGAPKDFAFKYELVAEVIPFFVDDAAMGSTIDTNFVKTEFFDSFRDHLYQVRVTCRWPMLPNGGVGPNRKTFRVMASGRFNDNNAPLHFFIPHSFQARPKP